MAAIHDLLNQVSDETLRARLEIEINKLSKNKKFGLVFEEHIPECTPLYDVPVKRGTTVAKKAGQINDVFVVAKIADGMALCINKVTNEPEMVPVDELVSVAQFGDPIFPTLQYLDSVENAPDSDLWHTLIEADNYHALQLLEYLYAGKVDCIYIDPPYNTGAKDWKYNNNYVDGSDSYRHSKWLSMMQKRLKIAKRLLNPNDSVLIVTIDEKEYLHLGCLLEEMFPEAKIQMISTIVTHHGTSRTNEFTRVNEFIYFVMFGKCTISAHEDTGYVKEGEPVHWQSLRRSNPANIRPSRPSQFYPIYVNDITLRIDKIGDPINPDVDRNSVEQLPNCTAVFPIRDDGTEMMWSLLPEVCRQKASKGYIKIGKHTANKPQQYVIQYLMSGTVKAIENGKISITGYNEDGSIIAENKETKKMLPRTQWDYATHDARNYGTKILKDILGGTKFSFPKSLYAVEDTIRYFISSKSNALVVDFFAGSGTTLHAVNLLNEEDSGHRRCIMVTNNEVSEAESKFLTQQGFRPGDREWENLGIARHVTWPRTVCSMEGHDINGKALRGNYLAKDMDGNDIPMSDGFKANAIFFKLSFLDKNAVALGRSFFELLPILWMKAGAVGRCPDIKSDKIPDMLILPQNHFAVITNEIRFQEFADQANQHPEINTVYVVTDSERGYREMISMLNAENTFQLYRDYLDNFKINIGR